MFRQIRFPAEAQRLCVSIYGPHFPYVAPKELFLKYMKRVKLPKAYNDAVCCETLKHYQIPLEENMALACQAVYCGMVEHGDYKYVTYQGYEHQDTLYNIKMDAEERTNLAKAEPKIFKEMKTISKSLLLHEEAQKNFRREARVNDLMVLWEHAKGDADESLRWKGASTAAGEYPEICYKNPAYFKTEKFQNKKP